MTEQPPEWEFVSYEWTEPTDPKVAGWNVDDVVAAERKTWPSFIDVLNSTQPLGVHGVSTIPDLFTHNVNMTYGYVLALAAKGRERLTMLDWGCGLGQHYAIARALWPDLPIQYTGVDLPKACEAARELSPAAAFVADASWQSQKFAFVMANGSLHYNKDWQDVLRDLIKVTDGYLLVTQLPIVSGAP